MSQDPEARFEVEVPAKARAALAAWDAETRRDPWERSRLPELMLRLHAPEELERRPALYRDLGKAIATSLDAAARLTNRDENLPRLDAWDGIGRRTEAIRFHPDYHAMAAPIYGSRVMADYDTPGREVGQMVRFFLLAHLGEAGHLCPLACTAGLIKILQAKGGKALRDRLLPRLLDPDSRTNMIGAQFVTEVQGGSDVATSAVRAEPGAGDDDAWRIRGEKWFCSVANADLYLVTARVEGEGDRAGTAGLGCFVIPRLLPDGSPNSFRIRRLKTKLGTRSMASAEIDWVDALAYPIGPVEEGFKNTVGIVLQTSRVLNAVGTAGSMARAWLDAEAYARHRTAFGAPIVSYPAIRRTLASMKAETWAATASSFEVAGLSDRVALGKADDRIRGALRMLTNCNKYLTSIVNTRVVRDGIEVLGGNGTIEDFSILPRLLRDALVFESWEGAHNVLAAQMLRDALRYDLDRPMLEHLGKLAEGGSDGQVRAELSRRVEGLAGRWKSLRSLTPEVAADRIRALVDETQIVFQGASLARLADFDDTLGSGEARAVLEHFLALHPEDRGERGALELADRCLAPERTAPPVPPSPGHPAAKAAGNGKGRSRTRAS